MKIVNLLGFVLLVNGLEIPAGEFRAVHTALGKPAAQTVETDYGTLPVAVSPPTGTLEDCRIRSAAGSDLPFPEPEADTVYLAPFPVRMAALASGRADVWGMGDRLDPADPSKGVKNLVS